jgi:pre-rRNA-processing protein TSR2
LTSNPPQLEEVGDLEEVLLQVMIDEFEVVVDDDSAEDTARAIWTGIAKLKSGDASELGALYTKWQEKQKKGGKEVVGIVRGEDKDAEDTDWDDDSEEEEEWNGFADRPDTDMDDAPPLVDASKSKQKMEPEIDEDGFTKVLSKKKR